MIAGHAAVDDSGAETSSGESIATKSTTDGSTAKFATSVASADSTASAGSTIAMSRGEGVVGRHYCTQRDCREEDHRFARDGFSLEVLNEVHDVHLSATYGC